MRKKKEEKRKNAGTCAARGCNEPGEYKAPKSRQNTSEYQYFCLEHVREFNRAWNYFDGWSRKEIEDFMDNAAHGHRPTWHMTSRIGAFPPEFSSDFLRDQFFGILWERPKKTMPRKTLDAFAVLDLEPTVGMTEVKSQYKKLVKRHHPDVNNGTKASEEAFKRITTAYAIVMKHYETEKR